jgi:hypothetical protein
MKYEKRENVVEKWLDKTVDFEARAIKYCDESSRGFSCRML